MFYKADSVGFLTVDLDRGGFVTVYFIVACIGLFVEQHILRSVTQKVVLEDRIEDERAKKVLYIRLLGIAHGLDRGRVYYSLFHCCLVSVCLLHGYLALHMVQLS